MTDDVELLRRANALFGVPAGGPPNLNSSDVRARAEALVAGAPSAAAGAVERSVSGVRAAVGTDEAMARLVQRLSASHEDGQRSTRAVLEAALADRAPAADTPMGRAELRRRMAARLRDQHQHVSRSRAQSRALALRIRRLRYLRALAARRRAGAPLPGGGNGRAAVVAAIRRALDIKGIHDPRARARWERGMDLVAKRESNYNALAVNNWDSNAAKGTPSKGAWQFIEPTFRSYWEPGTSRNQSNLVSQACAFINYAMGRYGVSGDGSNLADRIQQADPRRGPKGY